MSLIKNTYGKLKRFIFFDASDRLIEKVIHLKLSYLSREALKLLVDYVEIIDKNNIPGIIIETGCALGGSSILITKIKNKNRIFKVYDSFGMMPEPSKLDGEDVHSRYEVIKSGKSKGIGSDLYYGYESDLLQKVVANFKLFDLKVGEESVELIKGFYEETLKVTEPVALAHIDCDWYESVKLSLEQITPNLTKGGYLIIDDYYRYSGCTTAVDEFFRDKMNEFEFLKKERLVIKKIN